ncbi:MAG: hypothetical protein ABI430_01555 [Candidatus Taylorbacteria bacterium]
MKNKLRYLTALLVAGISYNSTAGAGIALRTLDEGVPTKPVRSSLPPPARLLPGNILGTEKVVIASLCALTSSNVVQSRAYGMAGMLGQQVPSVRENNPAAWYLPETNSLQSFDYTSTSFHSWMGAVNFSSATLGEFGHRIVVHAAGFFPVNAYSTRVSSSDTNLGSGTFNVATNTTDGQELTCSSTFACVNFGPDGHFDSVFNPLTRVWDVHGDDIVYSNGERPSQIAYTAWFRFGGTVVVTITEPEGFAATINQFIAGHSLTAELIRNGEPVDTQTVTDARPSLTISVENPSQVRCTVAGGQVRVPYRPQSRPDVAGSVWTDMPFIVSFAESFLVSMDGAMQFYRLRTN